MGQERVPAGGDQLKGRGGWVLGAEGLWALGPSPQVGSPDPEHWLLVPNPTFTWRPKCMPSQILHVNSFSHIAKTFRTRNCNFCLMLLSPHLHAPPGSCAELEIEP